MDDFTELRTRWVRYRAAVARLITPPLQALGWPKDTLRDAVQGTGMGFAYEWRRCAPRIAQLVAANPALWPELHVADKKGALPDATSYANARVVMERLP
jgi:hypothetical protein